MFAKLTIRNNYEGFLESKIFDLMDSLVSSQHFHVYTMVRRYYLYLLEAFIKDKNSKAIGKLLRPFQNFGTRLIANTKNLNQVDYEWFEATAFRPFEYLYPIKEMDATIAEIILHDYVYLLKDLINYQRHETFRMLLTHLVELHPLITVGKSSIRTFLSDEQLPNDFFDRKSIWRNNVYRHSEIGPALEKISAGLSSDESYALLPDLEFVLTDSYKKNLIKQGVFAAMVYSFFKKDYEFISVYLSIDDNDNSKWESVDAAVVFQPEDAAIIISLKPKILSFAIFDIRYRGFTIYFNQLVAYFLILAYKRQVHHKIVEDLNVISKQNFLIVLEDIMQSVDFQIFNMLPFIYVGDREEFSNIIEYYRKLAESN
ncbi:hypothetical protein OQZ33_17235 [Pedobacter sp. MC2016-05]|uniref:hypothetical protein n=1 Tax=Pedobacter sp. MC2016-05 TaxID=2994474 RepID=UPI0022452B37|nr:hypothetical protein [Pedobacter sp. MC2016-05]MCX2476081.1 hypothetical protein [Pedobacter sp. MC2016-05]